MTSSLGKLQKVDLRKAWNHEAIDFTNWLAKEDNLALLSDEIGIEVKLLKTEASVGKFNVDILAEEEDSGRKIIIENQLETTNHDHLGKIITYASGYEAEIIIWIFKDVRDEHRQAIEWLNEHTDEKINFFAIKMELWQIGDSPYAPKFQVISKPNDWAKIIKNKGSVSEANLSDTKLMQLEFWNKFREYCENKPSQLKLTGNLTPYRYDIHLGKSGIYIRLRINSKDEKLACEIHVSDNKELFSGLYCYKNDIEADLETNLDWLPLEDQKRSRVGLEKDFNLKNTDDWQEAFKWLEINATKFQKVFMKYIQKVNH